MKNVELMMDVMTQADNIGVVTQSVEDVNATLD